MDIGKYNQLQPLTKSNILNFISEKDIILRYLPANFEFNTLFSSPFRKDSHPSFHIKLYNNNTVSFKDFKTGEKGNPFDFVSELYGINFKDTLLKIASDFNILNNFIYTDDNKVKVKKVAKYENVTKILNASYNHIEIIPKAWEREEVEYWSNININVDVAHKIGKIIPISGYYLNGTYYSTPDLSFAYCEKKDGVWTYKIYRPFNTFRKWVNNNDYSVIELWDSLPPTGDVVCITSSRKDALCIYNITGIPTIAPQGESVRIKPNVFKELTTRFKKVYLLFDNDYDADENWGQLNAKEFILMYPDSNIENILIDSKYKSKDPSDLNINLGKQKAYSIIRDLFDDKYLK